MNQPPRRTPFRWYSYPMMALGLLILTVLMTLGALRSRERDRMVSHTLEILQTLERYDASILSAQVSLRDPSKPNDAINFVRQAQDELNHLLSLTGDDMGLTIRVNVLKSLTTQVQDRLLAAQSAPLLVATPIQNLVSDFPIAESVNELRKGVRSQLQDRQESRQSAERTFALFTTLVLALNLASLFWTYREGRRYVEERNRSEAEIHELNRQLSVKVDAIQSLNQNLETRIDEKTAQLRSAVETLKSNNEQLERFAYIASHDLQEPLRQVASFNNMLLLRYGNQLDEQAKRYLDYSVSGAKRLQSMLRGLLQYYLTNSDSMRVSTFAPAPVLASVIDELAEEIRSGKVEVTVNCDAALTLNADPNMFVALVRALLSNAVKFRCKEGTPTLAISLDARPPGWRLTVADNGIGVDERFLPRIFDIFARYHSVGEYDGVGVGMALSKRIVELHGGSLLVERQTDGPGTRVIAQVGALPSQTA